MNITSMIEYHIRNIQKLKPVLCIFKGFHSSFFSTIQKNKLLDASLGISIQELDNLKPSLIPQLFNKSLAKNFNWITYEEALVVGVELLKLYFTSITFQNNLFYRAYPALYRLDIDENTFSILNNDEMDLGDNQNEQLDFVYRYYGSLRKLGNQIFITYQDTSDDEVPFYAVNTSLQERVLENYEEVHLELSENEDEFLQLELDLLEGQLPMGNIYIAVIGDPDALLYNYELRLQVLQDLVKNRYTIYLVQKLTTLKATFDEKPYLSVLKRFWGYSAFRTLKMYKNIQNISSIKETTEISQAQIVDDIVQEALKAKNGDYRDIFVTSPTGAGKSVMFQVPAIYLAEAEDHLMTIIISPLIGLMNDQVQGLRANHVDISATINSEISPVEKIEIHNKIQEGKISILYISPETLLSRSDISQLIGKRQVGLFVIDEAHIVTTWGKAFRSDYWYLGTYLAKLRKEMNFPVATFTATAIYGGIEDMYVETRDSLNLINPISYFGYIRRDDLSIKIQRKLDYDKRFKEYLTDKNKILLNRVEHFVQQKQKTLVYFPTVKAILEFKEFVRIYGSENTKENLSIYYGPLEKEVKQENYLRFKKNDSLIMLATKAFGMGIDIPDIQNVYHFAPTGNVCDYVQEIGRAARALDQGYAYFDFLPQDFVHVQRLHGISTIKKGQLIQVIKKILTIMDEQKGEKIRSLLVSADEFRYIFQAGNTQKDKDDDIDNKVKTALLIIEKDYKAKLTYSPIIARPRSIFAQEYFIIPEEIESTITPGYDKYFRKLTTFNEGIRKRSICQMDLKTLWEEHYPSMTFPEFKYHFHSGDRIKLPFSDKITSVMQIEINLKSDNAASYKKQIQMWADRINLIMGRYAKTNSYFNLSDITREINRLIGGSIYASEMIASIILDSCYTYDRLMRQNSNFYNRFIAYDESRGKYHLLGSGYAGFTDWMTQETNVILHQQLFHQISLHEYEIYFPKVFGSEQEKLFVYLGLMEALGLLIYRVNGGGNPEISIRVTSRFQLERTANNPGRYRNYILENVNIRHKLSVEMLRYIFENQVDTSKFWDLIEDYFLGKVPEVIMECLS